MSGAQVAAKDEDHLVISVCPDVCWTPMGSGMVPVAYNVIGRLVDAESPARIYRVNGKKAITAESRIPSVEGNEAGTGGGVISGVNKGYCRPVEYSKTFRANGQGLVREGDLFAMNCNGPEGIANTYGDAVILTQTKGPELVSVLPPTTLISNDPVTGEIVIETVEELRDAETDAKIRIGLREVNNPATGEVRAKRLVLITAADGTQTYEAGAGRFDPQSKKFNWKTTRGALDSSAGENELDNLSVDEEGQLYFGGGDEAVCVAPLEDDIADDDPDLFEDPNVKAELAEEAAAQAEVEALTNSQAWLATKTAADIAGIVDPTPTADIVSAGMSLVEGDWVGLGLSMLAMIPYLGDLAAKPIKGLLTSAKAARILEKLAAATGRLEKARDALKNALRRAKEALRKVRAKKAAPPTGPEPPGPPRPAPPPPSPGDGGFTPKGEAPKKKTAREKLDESKEAYARKVHREEMEKAWKDRHSRQTITDEDDAWLAADERRRELAFDPANKQFKVEEARAALKAEEQGLLTPPVKRGIGPDGKEVGDDLVDGKGVKWDAKSAVDPITIQQALGKGENVLVHGSQSAVDAAKQALGVTGNSEKLIFVVTGP